MIQIEVNINDGKYPILIKEGLLCDTGKLITEFVGKLEDAVVVTNPTVGGLYLAAVLESLTKAGISSRSVEVRDGERFKTLDTVKEIYDGFLTAGLDRKGLAIALGGGVVGDMTGFAAATYLRGVRFVQIPTTLLSMVDASVGGKTGVDLTQGKNLVGAFNQPEAVLIDPSVLNTLDSEELVSGKAEVIKHGLIGNAHLFELMESERNPNLTQLVDEAVRVKVEVVQRDPLEKGERALLNLGHTFGHAFELISNYSVKHGVAVGIGLVAATKLSEELNLCDDKELITRIKRVLALQGLYSTFAKFVSDCSWEQVVAAMSHDKKREKSKLRFAVPKAVGKCILVNDPPVEAIRRAIEEVLV